MGFEKRDAKGLLIRGVETGWARMPERGGSGGFGFEG